jgi:cytochrome oxidase Cu insertion factor (SCO1/SenC/PrrC family)
VNTTAKDIRARNLRTVAALAALFLLPLVVSFWMYYGSGWHPVEHTNHGELLQPVRALPHVQLPDADGTMAPADLFTGKWALVYVGDGACEEPCRNALHVMRQTRLSLNDDMTRLKRVFVATARCCDRAFLDREHPGLIAVDASGPRAQPLLRAFPQDTRADWLFLVDPLGNLVMRYDARQNPKGLLEDLKKLLKLSHIG